MVFALVYSDATGARLFALRWVEGQFLVARVAGTQPRSKSRSLISSCVLVDPLAPARSMTMMTSVKKRSFRSADSVAGYVVLHM
jgi:hypothetical protein